MRARICSLLSLCDAFILFYFTYFHCGFGEVQIFPSSLRPFSPSCFFAMLVTSRRPTELYLITVSFVRICKDIAASATLGRQPHLSAHRHWHCSVLDLDVSWDSRRDGDPYYHRRSVLCSLSLSVVIGTDENPRLFPTFP